MCPLCRLIATAVGGRPDAAAHLLEAVDAVTTAVRSLHAAWVAAARPEGHAASSARPTPGDAAGAPGRSRVQRIDVT